MIRGLYRKTAPGFLSGRRRRRGDRELPHPRRDAAGHGVTAARLFTGLSQRQMELDIGCSGWYGAL